MKFKYLDKIMIKSGFFEKAEGVIIDIDYSNVNDPNAERVLDKYEVSLSSSNKVIWVLENNMEHFR